MKQRARETEQSIRVGNMAKKTNKKKPVAKSPKKYTRSAATAKFSGLRQLPNVKVCIFENGVQTGEQG